MKYSWLTMLCLIRFCQSDLSAQTVCEPISKPPLKTFVHQGWNYKIYEVKQDSTAPLLTVQRTQKKRCETIFEHYYNSGFECRDVNGDKWLDLRLENRNYMNLYQFNPLQGNYVETGAFGHVIGYCDPKWRVNDCFITRFDDKFDIFTYDLYKIVNYKQIVIGRIDFHVFQTEQERTFVSGINVFYKPNKPFDDDVYDETPSKTLSFAEIEPRFFKKSKFQKGNRYLFDREFDQDAFVKDYFKKHFKTFAP